LFISRKFEILCRFDEINRDAHAMKSTQSAIEQCIHLFERRDESPEVHFLEWRYQPWAGQSIVTGPGISELKPGPTVPIVPDGVIAITRTQCVLYTDRSKFDRKMMTIRIQDSHFGSLLARKPDPIRLQKEFC
jgi:hypothetical protein